MFLTFHSVSHLSECVRAPRRPIRTPSHHRRFFSAVQKDAKRYFLPSQSESSPPQLPRRPRLPNAGLGGQEYNCTACSGKYWTFIDEYDIDNSRTTVLNPCWNDDGTLHGDNDNEKQRQRHAWSSPWTSDRGLELGSMNKKGPKRHWRCLLGHR